MAMTDKRLMRVELGAPGSASIDRPNQGESWLRRGVALPDPLPPLLERARPRPAVRPDVHDHGQLRDGVHGGGEDRVVSPRAEVPVGLPGTDTTGVEVTA